MKIGMGEVLKGIAFSAEEKICRDLKKQGFNVRKCGDNHIYDIYAEKGDEKRIYELKIGKYKIQKREYTKLQEAAKELGAKLFVVYLEVPKSKEIEFNELNQIITTDLLNNFPSDLDSLSTHTAIDTIDNIELDYLSLDSDLIRVVGSGTVNLELQFGSNYDARNNDSLSESISVDFFFKLELDREWTVRKRYYKFDLSDY